MDTNKVYVNPNFNRLPNRVIHTSEPMNHNNHMYINPNFTRSMSDIQQSANLNRKIYVNPNFIKPTNNLDESESVNCQLQVDCATKGSEYSNSTQHKTKSNQSENISSQSRYCLIRRNSNKVLTPHQVKESCTIKINKYKSIPLNNFKNSLHSIVKYETSKQMSSSQSHVNTITRPDSSRTCFKLIKQNLKPKINTSLKLTPKLLKIKRNTDMKYQIKSKVLLSLNIRKKNNIPCRLFAKYGTCLRNLYGTCEYLHDKKHVSLCRKFIKGICHDKLCLLSHELSSKKMPTCYFYLKGMCTKTDCPYLHVKLSEKSKICLDFLKGYCDKGDKCLHRHIRQQSQQTDKKKIKSLYSMNKYCNGNTKQDTIKPIKTNRLGSLPESKNVTNLVNQHNEHGVDDGDCRYFKDSQNKEDMCEVLKPTRCKLGTLPSFIRL